MITALLDIENDHVYWPDAAERREIAADFEERGVPGGCVGIVDGCLIVLAGKPRRNDGADFFSYKGQYGFSIMGVCDNQKRLRAVQYGFVGSAHDNRVFKFTTLYEHPQEYFSHHQYLLADSAYTPQHFCVPLFKRKNGEWELGPGEVGSEGWFGTDRPRNTSMTSAHKPASLSSIPTACSRAVGAVSEVLELVLKTWTTKDELPAGFEHASSCTTF